MTKEQQDWMEYALAKKVWKYAREVWSRPDVCDGEPTHAAANKNLRRAITSAPSLWTAVAFRNYVAAHKKAMAWLPISRRCCENCRYFFRDENGYPYCSSDTDKCEINGEWSTDVIACASWCPKEKGGEE